MDEIVVSLSKRWVYRALRRPLHGEIAAVKSAALVEENSYGMLPIVVVLVREMQADPVDQQGSETRGSATSPRC